MSDPTSTSRGMRVTSGEPPSETWQAERTHREMMEQELMDLGVWLSGRPKMAKKNLKPVRRGFTLEPGVYYNQGTGMVDRLYVPQHVALGGKMFLVSKDPAASVEDIRRKVMEGR